MVVQTQQSSCRVISAEAKTCPYNNSRLCGVLELGGERRWARVGEGCLVVNCGESPSSRPHWRLPLRGLHLQPALPTGLAFSLTRHHEAQPTAVFKVKNDTEYERWVKTIAAELMRQTPLDSVRFLDILGITGSLRRTRSADSVAHPIPDVQVTSRPDTRMCSLQEAPCIRYRKRSDLPDVVRDLPPCSRKSRSRRREWLGSKQRGQSAETLYSENREAENRVSALLSRCQRSDVYVPVKEKKLLFESLCRRNEDERPTMGSILPHRSVTKAHSLADLTSATQCVKDMARIFEQKSIPQSQQTKHFFDVSDSLNNIVNRDAVARNQQKQFSLTDVKARHHSNVR